ncbi:MAG: hypothetical protein R3E79_35720 [Caldilineaceae bacterium]
MITTEITFFITGLVIGSLTSLVGAWLSYQRGLKDQQERTTAPLRYLMLSTFGLTVVGVIVLLIALFYLNNIRSVLVTGAGVIIGFWLIFFVLFFGWLRFHREEV